MKTKLFYHSCIFLLVGCGLHYEAPETLREKQSSHKEQVKAYLTQQVSNDTIVYESLSFGKSIVVKPRSYQRLDSLYDKKYKYEQVGRFDAELEEEIELQKRLIEQDSNTVSYVVPHVFSFSSLTQSEIIFSDVYIDHKDSVTGLAITDQFYLASINKSKYLHYLKNESFLFPGYAASSGEQQLYNLFRDKEDELEGAARSKHLNQLCNVITLAKHLRTADPSILAKGTVIKAIENRKYNALNDKFSAVDGIFDGTILKEYIVVYNPPSRPKIEVRLTPYYEFISMKELSE